MQIVIHHTSFLQQLQWDSHPWVQEHERQQKCSDSVGRMHMAKMAEQVAELLYPMRCFIDHVGPRGTPGQALCQMISFSYGQIHCRRQLTSTNLQVYGSTCWAVKLYELDCAAAEYT